MAAGKHTDCAGFSETYNYAGIAGGLELPVTTCLINIKRFTSLTRPPTTIIKPTTLLECLLLNAPIPELDPCPSRSLNQGLSLSPSLTEFSTEVPRGNSVRDGC
jgi:hypothetical protein